jgi:hypothetical protein
MSNTVFDHATHFGVTAHPEVGRRLWWAAMILPGYSLAGERPLSNFRLNHHSGKIVPVENPFKCQGNLV